jgi:hypothetical protein
MAVMRPTRRRSGKKKPEPTISISDILKAKLGWTASQQTFHTTARGECGGCHEIKPGSEFDGPVTPGRPELNICRECPASTG